MVVVRNTISAIRAGGPRQFGEVQNRIIVRSATDSDQQMAVSNLEKSGFSPEPLQTAPVTIVEPQNTFEDIIQRFSKRIDSATDVDAAIEEIRKARKSGERVIDAGEVTSKIASTVRSQVNQLEGVLDANFAQTLVDYGPENLRISPFEVDTLDDAKAKNANRNLSDLHSNINVKTAHTMETGDRAAVCIFDTGFARDLISKDRIKDTFHAGGTDSAFKAPEGHGTMCAGAAAANNNEGVPFNGSAPDADVYLVRITDSKGQIRSDIISKGWDWILKKQVDRPVVINHSYGTPLCSGRPKVKFCDTAENDFIELANSTEGITSVYAAGNEAMRCGHRLSGITNGITGTNSLDSVITVGALRYDLRDAQRYSSHGRGDCAPVADPKPNVGCALPRYVYYGGKDGYKIKDMEIGFGGSAGGTSHASPTVTGIIALMQSRAVKKRGEAMQTEEIKQILEKTAEPPRVTQVNFSGVLLGEEGYDARFGNGQIKPVKALEEV